MSSTYRWPVNDLRAAITIEQFIIACGTQTVTSAMLAACGAAELVELYHSTGRFHTRTLLLSVPKNKLEFIIKNYLLPINTRFGDR